MENEYCSPTYLYKRDALGRVVFWAITTNGVYDKITYGLFPIVDKIPQCILNKHTKTSISSEIKRKKDRGYVSELELNIHSKDYESVNQLADLINQKLPKFVTDADNVNKPMKCQKFRSGVFNYGKNGAIGQPKINGVRCTVRLTEVDNGLFGTTKEVVLKSKEGIRYNIKHIEEAFMKYVFCFDEFKNIAFDGEIYKYGEKNTSIGGAARNPKNPIHKDLQFVCFDLSIPDLSNEERNTLKHKILTLSRFRAKTDHNDCIFTQKTIYEHRFSASFIIVDLCDEIVYGDDQTENLRDRCLDQKYEGCVIRSKDSQYQFGYRPVTMMKAKRWEEGEFLCLDITTDVITKEIRGELKTTEYAKFICKNDLNDETFEVKPTSVHNNVIDETMTSPYILSHKDEFIGKMLSIKFYERTDKKIPFNANVFGVRNYE